MLVSGRDRLIQFKLIHRMYYIPARLASIYGSTSAECCRCTASPADFDHNFGHCREIQSLRLEVTSTLQELLLMPIPLASQYVFWGWWKIWYQRGHRGRSCLLLYSTHGNQLYVQEKMEARSLAFWKGIVNKSIPFYKATYATWGYQKKI